MKQMFSFKKTIDALLGKVFYSATAFDNTLNSVNSKRAMGKIAKKSSTEIILKAGPGTSRVPPPKDLGFPPGRFTLKCHPEGNTQFLSLLAASMSQSHKQALNSMRT
jgi:hypothetical protein